MNIQQKIGGAIATGVLLASVLAPSAFATSVNVSGNGAFSQNGAAVVNLSKSSVTQKNTTKVNTLVVSATNTGGNSSSFNKGGSNTITTGGSTTGVEVAVEGGTNTNEAVNCCCDGQGSTDVDITHNGAFSKNGVLVVNACSNSVKQTNNTTVNTGVVSLTNTGNNSSSFNTGGSNTITTGSSTTGASVIVTGSSNSN